MTESRPLSLRRNFSWTFVGNAFYAACQWGMLSVLAKLGTPQMLGQFILGLAVTAPVVLFMNLQLQSVLATDTKDHYRFGHYLALRLLTATLALAVISGIVFVAGYGREAAVVILLVGLAKVIESISDVFYGLFTRHERLDRLAKSMVFKGLLSLAALTLIIYLTQSVAWAVVGVILAWATVLFGYDIRNGAWVLSHLAPKPTEPGHAPSMSVMRPRWEFGVLARLAWLALPLGIVMTLISLNTNVPRYFIEHYLGTRELGVFAAMSYVIIAGATVMGALGQSASPRLARHYAEGDARGFCLLLVKGLGIGALLGIAGFLAALVAGREILTLLYSPEFAENTSVFLLLMVVATLRYVTSFLGYGMTAARYFSAQVPLFGLSICAAALACWWLIPAFELFGAATALLIAAAVQFIGGLAIIVHAVRKLPEKKAPASRI